MARGDHLYSHKGRSAHVRLKNNRAEEMTILLRDANKTVNGIITGIFPQFLMNNSLSGYTLSDLKILWVKLSLDGVTPEFWGLGKE